MRKEYKIIDIFKFLFAIGVVAIHCQVFNNANIVSWITLHSVLRLAVPFFFCTSGFFFYKSLEQKKDVKKTTYSFLKRISIPFVFWTVLNFPIAVYEYYNLGYGSLRIILSILKRLIFYPWASMWFLSSLIMAVVLVIPFYKKNKLKNAIIIGMIMYLIASLFNTYYFLIEGTSIQSIVDFILKVISSAKNGFTEGLYFLSVGMYISSLETKNKINYNFNSYLSILFYALLIIEILLTKNVSHADDNSMYIFYLFFVPCLVVLISKYNINKSTIIFRNLSSGIYFSHRFILGIITIFFSSLNSICVFIVTTLVVLIILLILYKIDNRKINMLIK